MRPKRAGQAALVALCFAFTLAACWVLPWRLGLGPEGSYYTFGYTADEYTYAYRLQPLIAGATATNPINGIGDPQATSQQYLDDLCRWFLTLTGLPTIGFIWVWRVLFPVCLAGMLLLLARICIARPLRAWSVPLGWAAAAANKKALICSSNLARSASGSRGGLGGTGPIFWASCGASLTTSAAIKPRLWRRKTSGG
jgi:hypothetical protein